MINLPTVCRNGPRHHENISVDVEKTLQSNRNTYLPYIPNHDTSGGHRSLHTYGHFVPKTRNHNHRYRSLNSRRLFKPDDFTRLQSTDVQATVDKEAEEAQTLCVLMGLSNFTLREMITDCVLELVKFNLRQTESLNPPEHKSKQITKPGILIDHSQQSPTFGDIIRHEKRAAFRRESGTNPRSRNADSSPVRDTSGILKHQLGLDCLVPERNVSEAHIYSDVISHAKRKPNPKTNATSDDKMRIKDQSQLLRSKCFLKPDHPIACGKLTVGPVSNSTIKLSERDEPTIGFPASSHQKRSPKLSETAEQRLNRKAIPLTHKPYNEPLRSSFRGSKAYSTNRTLKKTRFEHQGSVYSEASKRSMEQSLLA